MRLEQLNYLIAIERYHSMNKAANYIFVSQQSISNAIKQLEDEFQTKLILRTNKGSFLTEAGQALCQATQIFYTSCDAVKENFGQKLPPVKLHLLLEYSQLSSTWDSLFLYYAIHYSHVELERNIIDYVNLEQALEEYPESIAVSYLHDEFLQKFSRKYNCYVVKTYRLSLYVSQNSPLAQNKILSLKSLHHMKILFYAPKDRPSCLLCLLKQYELESRGNQYIYQVTSTLQKKLSARNDVVCFAPAMTSTPPLDSMVAIALKEKIPLHLCCISKNAKIPAELITALRAF